MLTAQPSLPLGCVLVTVVDEDGRRGRLLSRVRRRQK